MISLLALNMTAWFSCHPNITWVNSGFLSSEDAQSAWVTCNQGLGQLVTHGYQTPARASRIKGLRQWSRKKWTQRSPAPLLPQPRCPSLPWPLGGTATGCRTTVIRVQLSHAPISTGPFPTTGRARQTEQGAAHRVGWQRPKQPNPVPDRGQMQGWASSLSIGSNDDVDDDDETGAGS